jgi:hypothetical protein
MTIQIRYHGKTEGASPRARCALFAARRQAALEADLLAAVARFD